MLKQGEWVVDVVGKIGFIESFKDEKSCFVNFPKVNRVFYKANSELKPAPIEAFEEDDLYYLIDLSLKTHDKQWFEELTSKLPV